MSPRATFVIQQERNIGWIQPSLESAIDGSRDIVQGWRGLLLLNRTDARTALATMTLSEYHPIQAGNRSAVLQSIAKGHGAGKETTQ